MRNVPHSLRHLNDCFPIDSDAWGGLDDGTSLGMGFENLKASALPVFSLCFLLGVQDVSSQLALLLVMSCLLDAAMLPCHHHRSSNQLAP